MLTGLSRLIAFFQVVAAIRVFSRIVSTLGGRRIRPSGEVTPGAITVIVPVLNEEHRLGACIRGALVQDETVLQILFVDGGSTDDTKALVDRASVQDPRIRFVSAHPVPDSWNGKAWGMQVGVEESSGQSEWFLFLDADVTPELGLAASLVSFARRECLDVLSVATRQELRDNWLGLIHPSMLTTLVYRSGIPGHSTRVPGRAQANGQCMLVRRQSLEMLGNLNGIRASRCEDVTLARLIARSGGRVGFYETDGLISTRMYESARDAWHGWARSLPLRDTVTGWTFAIGLLEVTLAQGLTLPLMAVGYMWQQRALITINSFLLSMRLGVLLGAKRAYSYSPFTYWFSPLIDLPVCVQIWLSAFRTEQRWRGRLMVREL